MPPLPRQMTLLVDCVSGEEARAHPDREAADRLNHGGRRAPCSGLRLVEACGHVDGVVGSHEEHEEGPPMAVEVVATATRGAEHRRNVVRERARALGKQRLLEPRSGEDARRRCDTCQW